MFTTTHTVDISGSSIRPVPSLGWHALVLASDEVAVWALSGEIFVGRSRSCQAMVREAEVSRRHARLWVEHNEIWVEDLESHNGTRLNAQLIPSGRPHRVQRGDVIRIGSIRILLEHGAYYEGRRRILDFDALQTMLRDLCLHPSPERRGVAVIRWESLQVVPWPCVAAALASTVPPPHVLSAWGPRHLIALLPDVDANDARTFADAASAALIPLAADVRHGVATWPAHSPCTEDLLEQALDQLGFAATGPAPTWSSNNPDMKRTLALAKRAAQGSISVLLVGETGVGKEVIAQQIHASSPRAGQVILSLNCAGLSESLLESELFGHERGSFTGATSAKKGLLESANGGTVFLDEVGEMPLAMQAKILRALESREVLPVGATKTRAIDVRFIAATNRDLSAECQAGRFRSDLFYRLAGIIITVPPLRERLDEVPQLARMFLDQACRAMNRSSLGLTPAAEGRLLRHSWPGNVRELRNAMERAALLCDGDSVDVEHLPLARLGERPGSAPPPRGASDDVSQTPDVEPGPYIDERQRILELLNAHGWNQTRTARVMGVSRKTLIQRLEKYGIARPQKNTPPPPSGQKVGDPRR